MNLQLDTEVNIYLHKKSQLCICLKKGDEYYKHEKSRKIMIFTLFSSLPLAFHNFFPACYLDVFLYNNVL